MSSLLRVVLRSVLLLALTLSARAQSLDELASDPARWPVEVAVIAATRASVLEQGRPAGTLLLGAGRTLSVSKISAEGITGKLGGSTVLVPADKTDLWSRVAAGSAAPAKPAPAEPPGQTAPSPATVKTPAPAAPSRPRVAPTPFETALAGKLVHLQNGRVVPFDAERLNGVKFYGIYFSASWCGPCKQFTPELVRDYRAIREVYPEFEIVLISWDKTEADMQAYLRDDAMPWPAVRYADRKLSLLNQHAGRGIPCLVLVDASTGKALSHSYRRGQYVGPGRVIDDTWKILKDARRKGGAQ